MIYFIELILIAIWGFVILPFIYQYANVFLSNIKVKYVKCIFIFLFVFLMIITGSIISIVLISVTGHTVICDTIINNNVNSLYIWESIISITIYMVLFYIKWIRFFGGNFVKTYKSKIRIYGDGGKNRVWNIGLVLLGISNMILLLCVILQELRAGANTLGMIISTILIIAAVICVYLETIFNTYYMNLYEDGRCEIFKPLICIRGHRNDLQIENIDNKLIVKLENVIVFEKICGEMSYKEVEQLIKSN